MKKSLFLPAIFILFFSALQGQQDQFVEVYVEDTIQLDPDRFIYSVFLTSPDRYPVGAPSRAKLEENIDQYVLEDLIKQYEIEERKEETKYKINPQETEEIDVKTLVFTSENKLMDFYKELEQYPNVYAFITSFENDPSEETGKKLLEKLIAKAKQKASGLAQVMGKKLGEIVQITESKDSEIRATGDVSVGAGWTMYPPLSALPQTTGAIESDQVAKLSLSRGLTIRFLVK